MRWHPLCTTVSRNTNIGVPMSRHSAVALCALLAACKPTDDGKVVPDQAAADEVAKAFTADLVSPDESFRLVRLGTRREA